MSCSLYRWQEICDERDCPGDCDLCGFDPETDTYTVEMEDVT